MPNNTIPDLILVPAGLFWLGGSPDDPAAEDNEKPLHKEELPAFSISKYPITNAHYAEFIQSTNHSAPQHWGGTNPPTDLLDHPVVNISIIEAMSYCDWLSQQTGTEYTLPSEMQWEKAARGATDARPYVWGDAWKPDSCNTLETGIGGTTAVTYFENTNRSPFGVIDMLGNVWEWTKSYYLPFPGSPHETARYGKSYHIIRGGSWHNDRRLARVSCRGRYLPGIRRPYLGFRIISSINTTDEDAQDIPPNPLNPAKDQQTINKTALRKKIMAYFTSEASPQTDKFSSQHIRYSPIKP